jgi:GTP-binding protein
VVNSSLILTKIYEGQVIGENSRSDDMSVNVTKAKKQSNVLLEMMKSRIIPPLFSLEEALEYIQKMICRGNT